MDNPVHNRRSALDIQPSKRIPPSFYAALGIAIAVHAGLAYYLLDQRFGAGIETGWERPSEPPPIQIEMPKPAKPEPVKPNVIPVHKTVLPNDVKVETTPIIPLDEPAPATNVIVDTAPTLPTTGAGAGTGTGTSDATPEPVYVKARWSRFPDSAALTNYYPSKAADNEVEGSATVQCVVLDGAGRVSCVAVSEKPGGFGFGAATVRMVQDKGRVDVTQGNVQVGSVLRQTVVWRLD